MRTDVSGLKRPRHPMPAFVKDALDERGLMDAYKQRPAYQQNDYIGWILRAKRQDTKESRLRQMLEELEKGGVYMNMKHAASEKR
ncbi:YdeI/OmpD-associated family protein [Sorangium cellulosum]|uniref:YdeI/OmpD-associated family protein n=1 Tax=Sorangium cellulosum TaxID=56 RepID=UPI003D9A54F6